MYSLHGTIKRRIALSHCFQVVQCCSFVHFNNTQSTNYVQLSLRRKLSYTHFRCSNSCWSKCPVANRLNGRHFSAKVDLQPSIDCPQDSEEEEDNLAIQRNPQRQEKQVGGRLTEERIYVRVEHGSKRRPSISSCERTKVYDGTKEPTNTDSIVDVSTGLLQASAGKEEYSVEEAVAGLKRVQPNRSKIDLSYHDARSRESRGFIGDTGVSFRMSSTDFRANTGIRRILHQYMKHIEPMLIVGVDLFKHNHDLDRWLLAVFSDETMDILHRRGYLIEDVVSWGWILSAKTTTLSIKRYASFTSKRRHDNQAAPPLFLILQLLRSNYIDPGSLDLLLSEVEVSIEAGNTWTTEAGVILLIRLLRQARLTTASFYERIASLAPRVVPLKSRGDTHKDVRRLTHFYNRFLSLLALPLAQHPFLSVDAQQRAQLKIARSMMESPLQIPLNREGYRALARLQVMHKKTPEEQQWSGVKALSWPPWRHDELGIDAKLQYTGQQSRVAKVIRRLLEAGYGPASIEHEAKILAGWDIDKSPTIQVRRILKHRPLSWIKSLFVNKTDHQSKVDHHVWAARVAATRSVREAWLCFYSYMHASMAEQRQLKVYHEMFHKLFARIQHTVPKHLPSAGDGKEVFADPISPRDLVYVHKEPPSVDELYAQMVQDGIRPAGRLLASLLDGAQTLRQGFSYVNESTLGDVKKDLLLHPEKYPTFFIQNLFATLPDYLIASYIALIARSPNPDSVELFWPGSKSVEEHGSLPCHVVKSLHHATLLMHIWRPRYLPAYHAILEGICVQAKARRTHNNRTPSRQHAYVELWHMAEDMLSLLRSQGLRSDLVCFRKMVLLIRNTTIRAPSHFAETASSFAEATTLVKTSFADAVGGHMEGDTIVLPEVALANEQQPYWKDIESLIILLGFNLDFASVVDVLKWLRDQENNLICVDAGGYKMQRLACATRVVLEACWSNKIFATANTEQMQQAKKYVDSWGWPEDVDVEEYMQQHRAWLEGMRVATQHLCQDELPV